MSQIEISSLRIEPFSRKIGGMKKDGIQLKKEKGKVLNVIAWVLLVLQLFYSRIYVIDHAKLSKIIPGGLQLPRAIFLLLLQAEMKTLASLIFQLIVFNAVGIGGLILGLYIWLRRGNKKGQITTVAAIVVILISSILYFGCYNWGRPNLNY